MTLETNGTLPAGESAENTTTLTLTQEQLDSLIEEKVAWVKWEFEEKLTKLQNKQGYEARKGKESVAIDKDELISEAVAKLREEQQEMEVLRKYPEADVDTLKELKSKHPTLTWDEVVALSWYSRPYWIDWSVRTDNGGKKVYTKEEFSRLSGAEKQEVLAKVHKKEVVLDTR